MRIGIEKKGKVEIEAIKYYKKNDILAVRFIFKKPKWFEFADRHIMGGEKVFIAYGFVDQENENNRIIICIEKENSDWFKIYTDFRIDKYEIVIVVAEVDCEKCVKDIKPETIPELEAGKIVLGRRCV